MRLRADPSVAVVGATLIIASTLYTVHRNRLRQAPAAAKEAE